MNAAAYYFTNAMESETSVIARGLRRRDPDLLDHLIEQYQHRLLRYLLYLSGNRELAEDLFQETWIRVLERGHQYDGKHEFSTWLYAVARNLTLDYLRKRNPVSLDALMEDEDQAPFEPADSRPPAWEVVQQHEHAERINAALISIPTEYREAVVLRFQEGLALDEIASVTGAPLGTVKSRLSRAREALRGANAALLVLDSSEMGVEEDRSLAEEIRSLEIPWILALNKCDLAPDAAIPEWAEGCAANCRVSALTGDGIAALEAALGRVVLHGAAIDAAQPMIMHLHQKDSLRRASECVRRFLDGAAENVSPEFLAIE